MAECIYREEALSELYLLMAEHEDDQFEGKLLHWTGIKAILERLPAADVVEVVRCKDCFNRTKSGMCIQWSRYEKIVNTSDYAFCSWGVKTPPSAPEPPKEE